MKDQILRTAIYIFIGVGIAWIVTDIIGKANAVPKVQVQEVVIEGHSYLLFDGGITHKANCQAGHRF